MTEILELYVAPAILLYPPEGDRSLTLRPEGTASVCRAYVEHGMHKLPQPVKLWYLSSFFRKEKPQAGRFRQFWQVGAEAIGSDDPAVDAESIVVATLETLAREGIRVLLETGPGHGLRMLASQLEVWDGDAPVEQTGYLTDLLADRGVATHDVTLQSVRNLLARYRDDPDGQLSEAVQDAELFPTDDLEFSAKRLEGGLGVQRLPAGERHEHNSSDSGEQQGPPESLRCLASCHPSFSEASDHFLTTKPVNSRLGSKFPVPRYLTFTSHWPSLRTLSKRTLIRLSPPPPVIPRTRLRSSSSSPRRCRATPRALPTKPRRWTENCRSGRRCASGPGSAAIRAASIKP